jgi:hypothetical protein
MSIEKIKNGSYKVMIVVNGKRKHLGYFTSYDKGLEAYVKAKDEAKPNRKLKTK